MYWIIVDEFASWDSHAHQSRFAPMKVAILTINNSSATLDVLKKSSILLQNVTYIDSVS